MSWFSHMRVNIYVNGLDLDLRSVHICHISHLFFPMFLKPVCLLAQLMLHRQSPVMKGYHIENPHYILIIVQTLHVL